MRRSDCRLLIGLLLFPLLFPRLTLLLTFANAAPDEQDVVDTGLPVVYITLDGGESITDRETWKDGAMRIRNTENYSACNNLYTHEGGGIRLKGRGNSTWWQFQTQKRAYSLRLTQKTSLLGMDESKEWILLANFMDRSNLRNKFAYDLSGRLGLDFCESSFVNLYLNGNYQGVYQLCEKPSAPIEDWADLGETLAKAIAYREGLSDDEEEALIDACKNDLTWMTEKVFQGYIVSDYIDLSDRLTYANILIEYDYYYDEPSKFQTKSGVPLNIREPSALGTNREALTNLEKYFNLFEEAVLSDDFTNEMGYHYSAYVNMPSLVDYYIVNALIKNVEFGYKSMFLYTDAYGYIYFGPCWDYDWSSGNHFLGAAPNPEAWYDDWRASTNTWYHALYSDPYFVALVQERWFEVLPVIEEEIERLTLWENYLTTASDLERAVYLGLDGEDDYRRQSNGYSYADEVEELRQFLHARVDWMTEQFSFGDPRIEGQSCTDDIDFDLLLWDEFGELANATDCNFPIAYLTGGKDDILVSANTEVTFRLNGKLLAENAVEYLLTPDDLRQGVNVVIARGEVGGKWKQDVLIFETPKDKPTFVDIGRDTVAKIPSATVIYVKRPSSSAPEKEDSLLWGAAIASSCILLGGGSLSAWVVLRKKKI